MRRRGFCFHDGKRFICRTIVDKDCLKGDISVLAGHDANDVIELFKKDRK